MLRVTYFARYFTKRFLTAVFLYVVVFSPLLCSAPIEDLSGGSPVYRQSYENTRPDKIGYLKPGSAEERQAVARFSRFFSVLTPESVRRDLRSVYAADVYFNDTLKEIEGVDRLEPYLIRTAEAVESCAVDILDMSSSRGDFYFRWAMRIQFKKFRKGEVQTSIGITHIRFNQEGKVIFHQDYWDAAANLFEKIPVLGGIIRAIKNRL